MKVNPDNGRLYLPRMLVFK